MMFSELVKFMQCRGIYEWGHCFGCLHFYDCAAANKCIFTREGDKPDE